MSPGPRVDPGAAARVGYDLPGLLWIRLNGLHRNMAQALMHPVLSHALEQVMDRDALNAFHRVLYEPFEHARRANPFITFREFLATDAIRDLARRLLGEDYFTLVTTTGGRAYFDARERVLAALREIDEPFGTWMSWGHWRPGEVTVELYEGMPRLLPVDFPAIRIIRGVATVAYPSWSTARKRWFQNLAYVELLRRLPAGVDLPTDLQGAALLAHLNLGRTHHPIPFQGRPELRLTTTQVAQMLTTGRAPAWKELPLGPGEPPPRGFRVSVARNAEDARWELATRLGDPELADEATFEAALARHQTEAADTGQPSPVNPNHLVSVLNNAELVAVARNAPGAPRIATQPFELEHTRVQRAVRTVERMLNALEQVVPVDLVRHLCGLCDPHNIRLVTPGQHAADDIYAAYLGGGQRRVGNPARYDSVEARRPPPDDTIEAVPEDSLYEQPEDLVDPNVYDTSYDDHADVARGANAFFGFSPYYLEPVARLFEGIDVPDVLLRFELEHQVRVVETYNFLAGCINAAINSYGMRKELLLDLIVDVRQFDGGSP